MTTMYDDLTYDTDGGIATVTFDRPDVYNAFTPAMIEEVNDAIRRASRDDAVYVVVVTGAGNGFCAGADVSRMGERSHDAIEEYAGYLWAVQNVVRQIRNMPKPVIAAVNGPAIGAGADFALACDMRTIAPDAIIREGFVRVGLVPGDGGGWLLPRLVGESTAKEYLLTGKDITAEAADDMGLVADVSEDALAEAYEIAGDIMDLPVLAVRNTKRLVNEPGSFEDYCERAVRYQWECMQHPEQAEAVAAFVENREPEYDRDYA